MATKVKKLYRSKNDRMLAGVCAGIADYFGLDAVIVRISAVLITVFSGFFPGFIAYILLAIIIPEKGKGK